MKKESVSPLFIQYKLTDVIRISKIVTMHYFEFDRNFVFPGEKHDFWELVYVDSGQVNITAGKTRHVLSHGEMIFHKPNEFHTISAGTAANVFVISFVTTSKSMAWFRGRRMTLPDGLRPHIKTLLSEGKQTFDLPFNDPGLRELKPAEKQPFGSQQIIRNTLETLLVLLIRGEERAVKSFFFDKERMDNQLVEAIIKLLSEHVYDEVSLDVICGKLNYSKTYLSKLFRQSCGCSIHEYYLRLKMKEAKRLIREGNESFSEIANRLGFSDPHYFSRLFKKKENMTPREYRSSVSD